MKPYPRYKPTGIPWLPSVPEHWEVRKLRHLLSPVSQKNHADKPLLSVVREQGVILRNTESKEENHNFIPDDLSNYKLVRPGQFAMNKMKAWQGSYGISRYEGIVSPAYFVFNLKGVTGGFFHWAIRSATYIDFFAQASDGIRVGQWDLVVSRMKEIPFVIPPPPEQSRIVRYLDAKTTAIADLIRAKEREIELLHERKQALVSSAVTGGLDLTTERKDSGDPFTGRVPKNWQATQLNSCSHVVSKLGIPGSELLSVFLNHGVVKFSDMEEKRANATSLDLTNYQQVEPGDLVLNNQQAWRGSVGVSKLSGIVSPAYVVVKLDETWDLDFANYFFRAPHMVAHYVVASKGVGSIQRIIDWNEMKHVKVFRPDKTEQKQIADQLGLACKRFDSLETACRKQIALLQEFRTHLVSDAVTGAVEVPTHRIV
jgi:type I restriction enzyme S subunit